MSDCQSQLQYWLEQRKRNQTKKKKRYKKKIFIVKHTKAAVTSRYRKYSNKVLVLLHCVSDVFKFSLHLIQQNCQNQEDEDYTKHLGFKRVRDK